MAEIHEFPVKQSGGGGLVDPALPQRVAQLEKDMSRIFAILDRLEPRIVELHARSATQADVFAVKTDVAAVKADVARVDGRLDGIDKRFAMIPTTWQTISIIAMLLLGISGIIFTAGRFLRP